ncbi:MAG: thiamine diphosphokinase [Ilumatobacter sp.]|uniref:thiamine diphosphokinase n=1 Tax=Ilumatobacter sp. TaxID=1967498 RepID=UPI0039188AC3
MNEHIVVVTGAAPLPPDISKLIPASAIVLGVDGGLDHALAAGLRPSGLIGDLDSVSADGLAWAREHATISEHSPDKDLTDTELALSFAADMRPERITLVGGGNRLDHTLAAIGALSAPALTGVPIVDGWWDGQHLDVVHGPGRRRLHLEVGSTMSVLALGAPGEKVGLTGVRWPLDQAQVPSVSGLGVSNEVVDPDGVVDVTISSGVLTILDRPRRDVPAPSLTNGTPT